LTAFKPEAMCRHQRNIILSAPKIRGEAHSTRLDEHVAYLGHCLTGKIALKNSNLGRLLLSILRFRVPAAVRSEVAPRTTTLFSFDLERGGYFSPSTDVKREMEVLAGGAFSSELCMVDLKQTFENQRVAVCGETNQSFFYLLRIVK